jgi:hypothetical protein
MTSALMLGAATSFASPLGDDTIRFRGDGNCTVSMTSIFANRSTVVFSYSGFQPNETVRFYSVSENERGTGNLQVDALGNVQAIAMPHVIGLRLGSAEITASGSKCSISVGFKWWSDSADAQPTASGDAPQAVRP